MRCPSCSAEQSSPGSRCHRCGGALSPSGWTTALGGPAPSPAPRRQFPHGADFADRYTLIERIGEGGMGEVYKAIDRQLDTVVALKLIQPSLAAQAEAIRRFKSEVLLARQISHPNVCRVHDLGESGGTLYLSMAWIEGETLRRFMDQAGRLRPATALAIIEQVAWALEAAHARQVVHRDLKPENIMMDARGGIVVMDFGLATMTGAPVPSGAGRVVGTPPYIAPEQRRGEEADPRSDLYALGLILWEMLTGRWPASPPGAAGIRAGIPRPLAPVLASLLQDERAARCSSAAALLADLRTARARLKEAHDVRLATQWKVAIAAGIFVVAAGLAAVFLLPRVAHPPDGTSSPAGAGAEGAQAGARGPAPPVDLIAEPGGFYERGLHYLRDEGDTARGLGDAIQMLHRAVDGSPSDARAWALLGEASWMRFRRTRNPDDQREAEAAVTRALALRPDLPEALNARGLGTLAAGDAGAARADFERAVAAEPALDAAWENLGNAHRDLGNYADALRALQTAVRLRPDSYLHRVAIGRFHERFAEYDAAAAAYKQAIAIKPDQPWGWNNLGAMYLHLARRPEEAIPALRRSLELEERGIARTNLGTAYYFMRNFEAARAEYTKATELEPDDADNWGNLGDALRMLGRRDAALAAYRRAEGLARAAAGARPADAMAQNMLAKYCAKAGRVPCALEAAARANALQPDNAEIEFTCAIAHAAGKQPDQALDWLERAVRHGLGRGSIESEPFLEPLHPLPRYRALLERAG